MKNIRTKFDKFSDLLFNRIAHTQYDLSFVVEQTDWIIKRIGIYVTGHLRSNRILRARIAATHCGLRDHIVHFGSINTFRNGDGFHKTHPSSKVVLTWFHLLNSDEKAIQDLAKLGNAVQYIHTASRMTKEGLRRYGIPEKKIVVIPLGVNVSAFHPADREEKQRLKRQAGIPEDSIVVGSFQKDGVGWDQGREPKLIKGPDILVEVCRRLTQRHPVFVVLVGPARGYVESKLTEYKIPYKTVGYLENFYDIATYYNMLDFYLITSRIEGGPQQILEAWASGVPVVSTRVGMIADIAQNEQNALLTEVEDVEQLAAQSRKLLDDPLLKDRLAKRGLESVENYAWEKISQRYYEEMYSQC